MQSDPSQKATQVSSYLKYMPPLKMVLMAQGSPTASSSSWVKERFQGMPGGFVKLGSLELQIQQMVPLGISAAAKRPLPARGLFLTQMGQMQGMLFNQQFVDCGIEGGFNQQLYFLAIYKYLQIGRRKDILWRGPISVARNKQAAICTLVLGKT